MPVQPGEQIVRIICAILLAGIVLYMVKSALGIDLFQRRHATDLIDKPVEALLKKLNSN